MCSVILALEEANSLNSIAIDRGRTRQWVVVNNYPVRIAAFALAGVPITLHIWPRDYGLIVWSLFFLQFVAYPHLLQLRTQQAADPNRTERDNLIVDSFLCGVWAAGLGFPLWIRLTP